MTLNQPVKKQLDASLLLCSLALALCLSLVFIAVHAHHDCQGANCPICLHINQTTATLRSFGAGGFIIFSNAPFGCMPPVLLPVCGALIQKPVKRSLVALRTRMDD
ncbi:MAG TPA: hypothetical protein VN626_05600 [Clostridia bacterium]|nr:hypothetical protein [Clostridia bacterium]